MQSTIKLTGEDADYLTDVLTKFPNVSKAKILATLAAKGIEHYRTTNEFELLADLAANTNAPEKDKECKLHYLCADKKGCIHRNCPNIQE